jgi:hypothetical protein
MAGGVSLKDAVKPKVWEPVFRWLDRDVLLVRNALPFVRDIVRDAEEAGGWIDSTVITPDTTVEYVDAAHRNSKKLTISSVGADRNGPLAKWAPLVGGAESMLASAYIMANPHARVTSGQGWDLLRYDVGGRFGEHVDAIRGAALLNQRILAVVAFCNDDFEGGILRFPRQNLDVKPETGAVLIFPATFTHPHEVQPVTKGVRYSLVTWFH